MGQSKNKTDDIGCGALAYKCRMCGQTFNGVGGRWDMMERAITLLTLNDELTRVMRDHFEIGGGHSISRHDLHFHKDGTVGFGELIGLVED